MDQRKELGKRGEETAADYLAGKGYRIIDRNYKCRVGELDIIAMEGETLIFIEVKTRKDLSYGLPCESITATKKWHISRAVGYYTAIHKLEDLNMRIDVVEVLATKAGMYIHHIKDAI